jgi:hypothetical protein
MSATTRPIIFQDDMVRALLESRKTQTRRVVKGEYAVHPDEEYPFYIRPTGNPVWENYRTLGHLIQHHCPYGQPGDLLWVREAWAEVGTVDPGYLTYRATYPQDLPPGLENVPSDIRQAGYRWSPSIHMPRWASRLTLRLTDVRVERVRDIREGDAEAEGIEPPTAPEATGATYRGAFLERVRSGQSPLSKHGLDAWVWVLEFEVIHKNVVQAVRDLAPEWVAP